jgi:hypothetical protein
MFFFLIFTIVAWAFHAWGEKLLRWIPLLKKSCEEADCFGVLGVYRMSFALATFHLLLALMMIGVRSKGDVRVSLQDGWWPMKFLLVGAFLVAAFFIPNAFFEYYGWIALGASGLFILVQLVILVDFAHSWAENWIRKKEDQIEEGANKWTALLLFVTFFLYGLSLTGTIVMFVFFSKCQMNIAFISINIVLCIVLSVLSIHPKIQEHTETSGLLQAAVISGYSTYLVFSSMMSEPSTFVNDGHQCNPWASSSSTNAASTISVIIGAIITLVALVYSTVRAAMSVGKHDLESQPLTKEEKEEDKEDAKEKGDPEDPVDYSFTKFHFIFVLGAMYLAMLMSDWQTIWKSDTVSNGTPHVTVDTGLGAVWVKIVSSWLAVGIYCWTLIGPVAFPDRDWSRN